MYNFFNNQAKYKAFKKALKEVENEGFFENFVAEKDSVVAVQDMSKAVASLSKRGKSHSAISNDETLKATDLTSSLDNQRAISGEGREKLDRYQSAKIEGNKEEELDFYKNLFHDAPTFLNDQETQSDPEFLDKDTANGEDYSSELNSKIDEYNELAQRVKERRERMLRRRLEAEQENLPKTEIEPEMDMPVFAEEPEEPEKVPQVKVEVVADIPEPEIKTVTKTVVVTKEIPAQPKPKKKTTTTTRKRKRKYDADISGGFNY